MLWSSWHNHTGAFSYCATAEMTPERYAAALASGPWANFALTEHAFALALPESERPWPHQWHFHPERLWEHRAFREEKTARLLARVPVLQALGLRGGIEVEVAADGSLTADVSLLSELDVVIGSIHFLPRGDDMMRAFFTQLDALLTYPIHILGHPFRELSNHLDVPDEVLDETLLRARAAGVAVEINAHIPFARDPDIIRRAVALRIPLAFSLDAHHPDELGLHTYFLQMIMKSGVNEEDLVLFELAHDGLSQYPTNLR